MAFPICFDQCPIWEDIYIEGVLLGIVYLYRVEIFYRPILGL
jgi:hypothetical protein